MPKIWFRFAFRTNPNSTYRPIESTRTIRQATPLRRRFKSSIETWHRLPSCISTAQALFADIQAGSQFIPHEFREPFGANQRHPVAVVAAGNRFEFFGSFSLDCIDDLETNAILKHPSRKCRRARIKTRLHSRQRVKEPTAWVR